MNCPRLVHAALCVALATAAGPAAAQAPKLLSTKPAGPNVASVVHEVELTFDRPVTVVAPQFFVAIAYRKLYCPASTRQPPCPAGQPGAADPRTAPTMLPLKVAKLAVSGGTTVLVDFAMPSAPVPGVTLPEIHVGWQVNAKTGGQSTQGQFTFTARWQP